MDVCIFLYLAIVAVICASTIGDYDNVTINPKELYEAHKLNWLGVGILITFLVIINPIFFLLSLLIGYVMLGGSDIYGINFKLGK